MDADPSCIRARVSEVYFPKQDPRSGRTIYIYLFGRGRTPHQVARDFGHAEVFEFLMRHSPEDVKLAQACEMGDEAIFRALLASRPDMIGTLSDEKPGGFQTPRKTTIWTPCGSGRWRQRASTA